MVSPMSSGDTPTVHSFDRDGNEHDEVLRTASGRFITEADIEQWADEAEEGYEFSHPFAPILAGETRRAGDEPKCATCGKRKGLHKTLRPRR